MNNYENQKQVDELQKVIDATTPGIKLQSFSVLDNRALTAIVDIDEKGNKSVINKLISIGFRKVARYKKPLPFYVPLTTKDTFIIRLEKAI